MFVAALALAGVPGCEWGLCDSSGQDFELELAPPRHVAAVQIEVHSERAEAYVTYGGRVGNASPDLECPIAVFELDRRPELAAIAPLRRGGPQPEPPPGGRLAFESVLRPAHDGEVIQRPFGERAADEGHVIYDDEGEATRWWVIVTCGDAPIELDLAIDGMTCSAPDDTPRPIEITLLE